MPSIPKHKQKFGVYAVEFDGKCNYLEKAQKLQKKNPDAVLYAATILNRVAENADGPKRYKNAPSVLHQIEGRIWQLRFNKVRVLFFWAGEKQIVCSHFFVKKSDKTPKSEKEIAQECLRIFEENSK